MEKEMNVLKIQIECFHLYFEQSEELEVLLRSVRQKSWKIIEKYYWTCEKLEIDKKKK